MKRIASILLFLFIAYTKVSGICFAFEYDDIPEINVTINNNEIAIDLPPEFESKSKSKYKEDSEEFQYDYEVEYSLSKPIETVHSIPITSPVHEVTSRDDTTSQVVNSRLFTNETQIEPPSKVIIKVTEISNGDSTVVENQELDFPVNANKGVFSCAVKKVGDGVCEYDVRNAVFSSEKGSYIEITSTDNKLEYYGSSILFCKVLFWRESFFLYSIGLFLLTTILYYKLSNKKYLNFGYPTTIGWGVRQNIPDIKDQPDLLRTNTFSKQQAIDESLRIKYDYQDPLIVPPNEEKYVKNSHPTPSFSFESLIKNAPSLIERNTLQKLELIFGQNISNRGFKVTDAADELNMTPRKINKHIKNATNKSFTFQKLLIAFRMEKAKNLLINDVSLKISSIAEKVGYTKEGFIPTFKKYFEHTPLIYRFRNQN